MERRLLLPVVALVAWTCLMGVWMMTVRLAAIRRSRMKLDPDAPRGEQMSSLPARVRWKADNHNHLMEQPTLFYAIMFVDVLFAHARGIEPLAWTYVILRVGHSLVQALWNKIEVRFGFYLFSSLALFAIVALVGRSLI